MTTGLAATENGVSAALLERVVVGGDLSKLEPRDRLIYYRNVCESVGLNPLTRPFDYLTLSGRMVLYAKRDATDQLRRIHGVSITKVESEKYDELYVVTAYAQDHTGRTDTSKGAVAIAGLKGDALANAVMKAETKAKRRVTLSLCGLGILDETEIGTVAEAGVVNVDHETGELQDVQPAARQQETPSTSQPSFRDRYVCTNCGRRAVRSSKFGGLYCDQREGGCNKKYDVAPPPPPDETQADDSEVPF